MTEEKLTDAQIYKQENEEEIKVTAKNLAVVEIVGYYEVWNTGEIVLLGE